MRFGICSSIERIPEAAEAGYEYVELAAAALLPDQDEKAFAPVRRALSKTPIRPEAFNCFLPGTIKVVGAVNRMALEKHATTVLRRASEVGATIVVFGSGAARQKTDDLPIQKAWAQLADAARLVGEIAARYGITIAMEPLRRPACNFFNRVDQGISFVDRLNHPQVKLLADLYHVEAEKEPFVNITTAGKRLAHIHLATPSIPATGPGIDYDMRGYIDAVRKAGYDGRMTVEDNPGLFGNKQPPMTEIYRAVLEYVRSCV